MNGSMKVDVMVMAYEEECHKLFVEAGPLAYGITTCNVAINPGETLASIQSRWNPS